MFCPVIELAKELIRIPSISPNDLGCQKIIINRLKSIGFIIQTINVKNTNNIWAYRGSGVTLTFLGHTDVVPINQYEKWNYPPFKPTIFQGMLFGRGAADMKGALAAMIIAVEEFVRLYPFHKGRLSFIITSDEESDGINGTKKVVKQLISKKENIDYCLVGEPSSTEILGDVIKNGRRGSITANLTIYGISGHVAYPQFSENPIHRCLSFLNTLISHKWDNGNEFFPPTILQLIDIRSNNQIDNVTPDKLFIKFNLRFNNEITENEIKLYIEKLLNRKKLKYSIEWKVSGKPFLTKKEKLVNVVVDTVKDYIKVKPKLLTSGGTSDGRFLATMGAQVVELGPVNKTIHQTNECVKISDLQLLSLIYQDIIKKLIL